jgi:hypothetical protein
VSWKNVERLFLNGEITTIKDKAFRIMLYISYDGIKYMPAYAKDVRGKTQTVNNINEAQTWDAVTVSNTGFMTYGGSGRYFIVAFFGVVAKTSYFTTLRVESIEGIGS